MNVRVYFLLGLAGSIGAILRYLVGYTVDFWWVGAFPFGTFLANMLGSFALGWFTARIAKSKTIHPNLVKAVGTGLIGSFTTFSTFSVETVTLIQTSFLGTALLYVLTSLFGGLLLSLGGYKIGERAYEISKRRVGRP